MRQAKAEQGKPAGWGSGRTPERTFWTAAITWFLLDALSKAVAVHAPAVLRACERQLDAWLGDVVAFQVLRNPGAGLGIVYAGDQRLVATALGMAAVVYFYVFFQHMPRCGRTSVLGLGCMMGGASGNLADRVGSPVGVVDFIHVDAGAFAAYVFNVADVAIVTGGLLICWALATREIVRAPARAPAVRRS